MSDDEVDKELLQLLQQSLGLKGSVKAEPADTKVLRDAQYIYDNSIDVAIDSFNTKAAASMIWQVMQEKGYSSKTWSTHPLHPKARTEDTVNFIFTMDLLNFSFWSGDTLAEAYSVDYEGRQWTGYWSLVAALQRALSEGIPVTSPDFWQDREECTDEILKHIFRSSTSTLMPMLDERISILREAGEILYERFECSIVKLINQANGSAAALVNLIVREFPSFRDEALFYGKRVRLYKRAQIFVADLWACFEGISFGQFGDIDNITMFADYRVPQMLHMLGCIQYSPPLNHRIRKLQPIEHGHSWEVQLRGCSIWCIELIRRQILLLDPRSQVNAILIDFFLYDTSKEKEEEGIEMIPHHRTRTICY